MSLPPDRAEKSDILSLLKEYGLELVAQHSETADSDYRLHKKNYTKRLYNLADARPLFINSQTGKDYFSFEENSELIDIAIQVERETGVHVMHETHRGKFSFAVHIMRRYLDKYPDIELGLDVSHWCNVAESLLKDQKEDLDLALIRTRHIHARVGHPEGPQITDPRLPEWEEAIKFHLSCWDSVFENFRLLKKGWLSITPEFGPYPYMMNLPFTRMPVANQWDINLYMMKHLRERYGRSGRVT